MFKMRFHLKKILLFFLLFCVIWLLSMYFFVMDVPKTVLKKGNTREIELQLEDLKNRVNTEIHESSLLLEKVRNKFPKPKVLSDKPDMPAKRVLPVLVIACDRVTVKRCLDNLIRFRPSKEIFPIIVSQDCAHEKTYQVIKKYVDMDPTISVVRQPDQSEIKLAKVKSNLAGYYKIARHYKFALNHVFKELEHEAVIIVEDDLDISPDFFEYFLGTYPLLLEDSSIWCISAWNDNGKREIIETARPGLLHRTDFFPGLGWMMRRQSWMDLEPKWPAAFFDDWLRDPVNTKSKACIRPEIPRTYSFGKVGVSRGLFFDMHLRHLQLNMEFVAFTKLNLSYLLKENYDDMLHKAAYSATALTAEEVMSGSGDSPARVSYSDAASFHKAAKALGLMDDFRSGIPRTAYMGIVQCFIRGRRVYLAPDFSWSKYDPQWA